MKGGNMEITIKEVPEDAAEFVKNMALLGIEKFIKDCKLKVSDEKIAEVDAEIERIRKVNTQ